MKKPKRQGTPMTGIENILPIVGQQLNLEAKVQEWAVLALWAQLLPEPYCSHTKAVKIKRTGPKLTLLVKATNAAVASQLTFQLESWRQKLNDYARETGIHLDAIQLVL